MYATGNVKYEVRKTVTAIAPFPFKCSLCGALVGGGLLLDKGKGKLDLTCPGCAKQYLYVEEFILPTSAPGIDLIKLIGNTTNLSGNH